MNRFDSAKEYKNAKLVTEKRLYLETLEKVLPSVGKIYVVEPNSTSILPLLNLSEGAK